MAAPVWAKTYVPEDEYKDQIRVSQDIQPLGATPFGENINLYDGSLSFEQTDVSLAGNGPLLELTRENTLDCLRCPATPGYRIARQGCLNVICMREMGV